MQDYEYLFSTEVHRRLKEKVKGKVWVKAYNNELHVKITYDYLEFETTLDNLSDNILHGLGSEYAVYLIMKHYHNFVNDLYFK